MFEFLTQSDENAIAVLKHDHQTVKDLFDRFEKTEDLQEKRKIAADAIQELKMHAAIEEEIFYALVRPQIEKKIMNEADEEHHVAKFLIAELEDMDGGEDHYEAKFKVLSENVRHHIKEEENDMLPKARALDLDMEAIGRQLLARKQELMENGVDTFAEEKMIRRSGVNDSPADAANRKTPGKARVKLVKPAHAKPRKLQAAARKLSKSKINKPATRKVKKPVALKAKKSGSGLKGAGLKKAPARKPVSSPSRSRATGMRGRKNVR